MPKRKKQLHLLELSHWPFSVGWKTALMRMKSVWIPPACQAATVCFPPPRYLLMANKELLDVPLFIKVTLTSRKSSDKHIRARLEQHKGESVSGVQSSVPRAVHPKWKKRKKGSFLKKVTTGPWVRLKIWEIVQKSSPKANIISPTGGSETPVTTCTKTTRKRFLLGKC